VSTKFESLGAETKYDGQLVRVGVERFRHSDGEEIAREKVWHPGAVGIIALDATHLWLTRQPREAVGAEASLEIPAGKLDEPGEAPLQTAQRELVEEIGKRAARWEEVMSFYTSPGFSDERVLLYLATGLSDATADEGPEDNERIEVVPWPLERLEEAVEQCEDSKSLIALLWLVAGGTPRAGGASGSGGAAQARS
jgi:ADP-ribose pyrophosphatase